MRFWSSFIYDCSGLFPEVQLLPTTQDDVSVSSITDPIKQEELNDNKVTSSMEQGVTFPQVGSFEIIDEIGEGNFSKVYKAINTLSEEVVALKVLQGKPFKQSQKLRNLLIQREQLAVTLAHSHIIPVYKTTEEYEDIMCIAMKLIESGSLGDRLSHWYWRPSTREILNLVRQAVEGLKYLHEKQIIHGDIKPANLLVSFDDHVYLTDFGITKVIGSAFIGMVVGTPEYLAPEAILHPEQADGRVDLYAIGIMLYELFTGKPPFRSESPVELLHLHVNNLVSPIKELPESLNAILLKCLQKDPQERFQSADELRDEIDKLLATLPDAFLDLQPSNFVTDPEVRFKSHGIITTKLSITFQPRSDKPRQEPKSITTFSAQEAYISSDYKKIGPYEIIHKVGEGGFSTVYKALDTIRDRVVALKVLEKEKIGKPEEMSERLLNHEQHLIKLRHSNLVSVYEVVKSDGVMGVAMQLVEGGSLADRLRL